MYESIKDIIEKGDYELADILEKINTVWLKSYITKEEMESLAKSNTNVQKFISSKEIIKVITIPGRLVNIVVK